MTIDFQKARPLLQEFQFSDLFVQQLGWSYPAADKSVRMEVEGQVYSRSPVAELSGVGVFEVLAENGEIPNATARMAIYKEIAELVRENMLIFVGKNRTQCVWYWVKRDGNKLYPRDHVYVKREPCDLLLSKISALYVSLEELESLSVIDVAQRLQAGLDVERITKKFFEDFKQQHLEFLSAIRGIDKEGDRRWYTSVLLNRLMFVYFLQRKGFIDGGKTLYLQEKLTESQQRGTDLFYRDFLPALFFDGFAKPVDQRSPAVMALIGDIKYLNGGLFLTHQIEQNYPDIAIPDEAFEKVFALFAGYSWNLDDTLEGKENEINPAVLGYIFEKYINQKAFGAYYTRAEITEYLCDKTINKLILDRINQANAPRQFETITELLTKLDAKLCRQLLEEILPTLSLLDPACGSGAFLVAAMKTLIYVYSNVIATVKVRITDHYLNTWLTQVESEHPSLNYYIKKRIITDNLYGVDIMEEATEIAKLRLFLALVSSAHNVKELEPLPNIDFNIMAGNSLIGLIRVDETGFDAVNSGTKGKGKKKDSEPVAFQGNLLQPLAASAYQKILTDKNDSIDLYKKHAFQPGEQEGTSQESRLLMLRGHIEQLNRESQDKLNLLLLDEFSSRLGIKYQEVQISGKPKKRVLKIDDIAALKPFHWGYHFDRVLQRGGFDVIIANPPWEIFKPNAREFFLQHSELVNKSKMDIKAFEKEQSQILEDPKIAAAWLEYQSQFPHLSAYYRSAEQYQNQVSIVNGKKAGTDINLYKLFLEQCFNLLRPGGECGIIIPSGIYTDLGAKQLREMLFSQSNIDALFGLSNEKFIFEGVHHSFKFCLITFAKGGVTDSFWAAFRIHPREAIRINQLDTFLNNPDEHLVISLPLVRRLSPDSLSVMEFKSDVDIQIAEKMLKFPLLGENMAGKWNLRLTSEFHMTNDSYLFKQQPGKGKFPLYEGKMIHQFTHLYAEPRYWVDEGEARKALLGKKSTDNSQKLDYQCYRFAYRAIARSTDSRTLIGTILPKNVVCGHSLNVASAIENNQYMLLICAVLNSVCFDFALRQKVSANLTLFFLYQTPVPRLTAADRFFAEIVDRAAKLICTTPEFDELAQEVGLSSHQDGVTDEGDRAQLRAELDGIIAHIYGLNEEEFTYILSTFPLVSESVKEATLEAYRNFAPLSGDSEIINLITQGEGHQLEFKSTARWNLRENKKDKAMEHEIVKTVAGFLNASGGTLLIGINDDGVPLGLKSDYQTLKKSSPDGLALFLNNDLLLREIGKECGTLWEITVHQVSGFELCRVVVQPSPKPIYVKVKDKAGKEEDCFYLRSNNSTVKLSLKEAVEYAKTRWG
ncbi:ATP-binding protein [Laspinema olomoucense]|uniref:site-specific DNA-methyltransferase (adenine-specific) n=1 Tax=Laspinema olomoucense D3b TaxID=2953688 RepID=A0ABT2NAP9_9CYAN|nr:ATP-binding protein [Laspinema sp. D3b]MCT7979637.1 ATP-binding protein [Laspinema sp. D3b]